MGSCSNPDLFVSCANRAPDRAKGMSALPPPCTNKLAFSSVHVEISNYKSFHSNFLTNRIITASWMRCLWHPFTLCDFQNLEVKQFCDESSIISTKHQRKWDCIQIDFKCLMFASDKNNDSILQWNHICCSINQNCILSRKEWSISFYFSWFSWFSWFPDELYLHSVWFCRVID
jgi:hypothetical protein